MVKRSIALLLLTGLAWGAPTDQDVVLHFKPSRDMPVVANQRGRFAALNGMCNGIDELVNVYYRARREFPGCPSMAEATERIRKEHGDAYLHDWLETTHFMSLSQGQPRYHASHAHNDPAGFADEVAERLQLNQQPISLALFGPQGGHRVSVYGAHKVQGQWVFQLADPNYPQRDQLQFRYDSKNHQWLTLDQGQPLDSWTAGDVVRSAVGYPVEYNELVLMGLQGKPIREIRTHVHLNLVPSPGPRTVLLQNSPTVGGVSIEVDLSQINSLPEAEQARLDQQTRQFMSSQQPGAILLTPGSTTQKLTRVALRTVSPSGDLGLTALKGFLQRPDGIWLVGLREPGQPPIPAAYLTVALGSIYARGLSPYISLDPDPSNYSAPQHVRYGGLPDSLKHTSMVLAMLDADYLMKRINLGRENPPLKGFLRWVDIMDASSLLGTSRMWLTPAPLAPGDYRLLRSDQGLAVLFECHPLVQAEQEQLDKVGLQRAAVDAAQSQACSQLSGRYPELCHLFPAFKRLQQVFEVATLAAIWRSQDLKSSELSRFSSPPFTAIPDNYPGIGPEVVHSALVSGGATTEIEVRAEQAIPSPALAPLLESSEGPVTVTFPAVQVIPPEQAQGLALASLRHDTQRAIQEGDGQEALRLADELLHHSPTDPEALRLHANACALLGHLAQAEADLTPLKQPQDVALRAFFESMQGQVGPARADLALGSATEDDGLTLLRVQTLIQLLDLDQASQALNHLHRRVPGHPMIPRLDHQITYMRSLGPAAAADYLAMVRQIPLPLSRAMLSQNEQTQRSALLDIEEGRYQLPPKLYVAERLRLMLAMKALVKNKETDRDDFQYARSAANRLKSDHPDWMSGYFCSALLDAAEDVPQAQLLESIRAAAHHDSPQDPLTATLRATMGVQNLGALLPTLVLLDNHDLSGPQRLPLIRLASELSPPGPGHDFFQTLGYPSQAFTQGLDPNRIGRGTGQDLLMFDRLTEHIQQLPPDDPAWPFAFSVCMAPLQGLMADRPRSSQLSPEQQLASQHLLERGLRLAAISHGPQGLPFLPEMRCAAWLQAGLSLVYHWFSPDYPGAAKLMAIIPAMDRMVKPGQEPIQKVKAAVNQGALALEDFAAHRQKELTHRLTQLTQQYGSATAVGVAFVILLMEDQAIPREYGQKRLLQYHPGLAGSPELQHLERASRQSRIQPQQLEKAWNKVLAGLRTRYDAQSVGALVEALQKACTNQTPFLQRCRLQAQLAERLGVLDSSPP